jgi:hypothetical protein
MFKGTQRDLIGFFGGLCLGLVLLFGVTASAQGPIPNPNKVTARGYGIFEDDPRDAYFSLFAKELLRDGTVVRVYGVISDQYRGWWGRVRCLSVKDNQAWVGGVITGNKAWVDGVITLPNPPRVGEAFLIRVEDNGTSQQDPPDRISAVFTFPDPGFQICGFQPDLILYDMPNGQAKVKVKVKVN